MQEDIAFDRERNRRRRMRRKKIRHRRQMFFGWSVVIVLIILLLLLSKCSSRGNPAKETPPGETTALPSGTPTDTTAFWPNLLVPSSKPSATPEVSPSASPTYDFSKPVPETQTPVEDTYFQDAVFIGNSRTEGFFLYSGLTGSTSYATQGLNINTVFTRETVKQEDGTKISVLDALRANSNFKKVYIMLGLNELGWVSLDQFQAQYAKLVDAIREISPDAIIYLQSILPVSEEKSASSNIYNNDRIQMFNQRIFAVAQEKQVFYINVTDAVADENGCLPSDFTSDGIHLQKKACKQWLAYLKSHTIPQEVLDALPTPSVPPTASAEESPAPTETNPGTSPSPSPSAAAETETPANTESATENGSASAAPSPSDAAPESNTPAPSAETET